MTKQEYNARLSQIHAEYAEAEKQRVQDNALAMGRLRSRLRAAVNDLRAEYNADA